MTVALAHHVEGPDDAPAVLLSPSLGTTWEMWDPLASVLASGYRVVRFDTRGHGRSPVTPGPYAVAELASDVLALADTLGIDRFGFVGLSLGGAIGQELAISHPSRVAAAVLACTVPSFGDPATWTDRAALVRDSGMPQLAEPTRGRWFTDGFRAAHPDVVERHVAMLTGTDPEGYASCCDALGRFDRWDALGGITVPVRVVAGAEDPVATVDACTKMTSAIPGADLVVIEDASHIANAAQPEAFAAAVLEHLGKAPVSDYDDGMVVRREVLGDEHVDRATASINEVTEDFQELITRYAWGGIWTRPGLGRRERSVVTLTALVAGRHFEELEFHLRAALRNGLTKEEIIEVLLQTSVYIGVPAANSAFAVASRVLAD